MKIRNILFLLALTLIPYTSIIGQTKRTNLSEFKVGLTGGLIQGQHVRSIDMEVRDTSEYVLVMYRDANYRHIIELDYIALDTPETLDKFKADLSALLREMEAGSTDISWERETYRLSLGKIMGMQTIIISNNEGSSYGALSKGAVRKLNTWLQGILLEEK